MNDLLIRKLVIDWKKLDDRCYVSRIPALRALDELTFSAPVTFFAGENGSGKSTLLEAIAVSSGFNPEGGTRNYAFSTYDSHSPLHQALRLTKGIRRAKFGYFLRAESFYNVATKEEEYADLLHPSREYHKQSHGESFMAIAQDTLRAGGLYLLDEPEAALSPLRQLSLLKQIHACAAQGAQFIVATHSPILLGLPGAQILSFDGGCVHPCAYEDTESYRTMDLFINHRPQLLGQLLAQDP